MRALIEFQEDCSRIATMLEIRRPDGAFIIEAFGGLAGAIAADLREVVAYRCDVVGDDEQQDGAHRQERDREDDRQADDEVAHGEGSVHGGDSAPSTGLPLVPPPFGGVR